MNRPRYDVPPELTNLLLEFTVNVMIERPTDLVDYAVRYFTGLREERLRNASSQQQSRPPAIDENDEAVYSDDEEPISLTSNPPALSVLCLVAVLDRVLVVSIRFGLGTRFEVVRHTAADATDPS
ncbi:hypothetical protein HPB47_007863 [Ixodes persulcatus]|uniref:Uncharacterized protein n=1 Tax=Ixodes persulcatus TaxID=34615 RepID=A0AC60P6D7_IXOPE|nr:hypothetical protein HPB47_007863 [Ixodes persulcatus]